MGQKLIIDKDTLVEIADAVREKSGTSESIQVSELSQAIIDIPSGGVTPSVGFVPTEYTTDGLFKKGIWYGSVVPAYSFKVQNETTHLSGASMKLEHVTFNDSLTEIGKEAFRDNRSLASVSLPSSLTRLESGAFQSCYALDITSLPSSLTYIGGSAFSSCYALSLSSIPDNVSSIGSNAFMSCSSLKISSIPSQTTTLSTYAFRDCQSITNMVLHKNITSITGGGTFYGCIALETVTFQGTPKTVSAGTFTNCTALTTINVPWSEGAVAGAPWGATNATINYNYTGE